MKGNLCPQDWSAQPHAGGEPNVMLLLAATQNSGFMMLLGSGLALPFSKYVPHRYCLYLDWSRVMSTVMKLGGLSPGVLVW